MSARGNAPVDTDRLAPALNDVSPQARDFSVVLGGPLFQLLRRAHMTGNALELLRRRVLVIALLAWLPLLVLALLQGQAFDARDVVPFVRDVEVHARFLLALPLLIVAELVIHQRLRLVVRQFLERDLVPAAAQRQFNNAITAAYKLRNSVVAEVLLLAFVYGVGILVVWRHYAVLDTGTWYALPDGAGGTRLSLAGAWYGYVSLPLFQFLLLRWYFRLFIWARFLWQVSRIDLQPIPTHPDRVGGFGFLANTVYAFIPLLLAHGVVLSGMIANRIFYSNAALLDFKIEIAVTVAFLMLLVFVPLLVFTPRLLALKRRAAREYGTLAQRYVREFDAKWVRGEPPKEPLLGHADIQSLADLDNSLQIVLSMRAAPITRDAVVGVIVAVLLPLLPLMLTMMSLDELAQRLLKVVF